MSTGDTCWPTSAQYLLLQAVLLGGTEAVDAWQRWKAAVDQDRLDAGSSRLLPSSTAISSASACAILPWSKLRELYCHTWYVTQLRAARRGDRDRGA